MPLPIWMTSSSTVRIGSVIWRICGLSCERWEGPGRRPIRRSVRLGVWRSDIWVSTWVMVRCVPKLIRRQQLRPVHDPRPKRRWGWGEFLGLAGYYRRFIPNYSDLTSPLTDLTKKEVPDPVQWPELCQQAFTQVKAALCGGPLLHSPDFSLQFLLQTDASDWRLGAVLSQEIEGEERPVQYISRKLSKRETMYSTIEKECLAIRWAVLTLRYYLLGWVFTLWSDHAPLQ